jgi:Thiol:disulfide interchange protein DsbD, N-terminal
VVSITGKTKPESVKVIYPEGKVEKDEVVGNYMIYEDKVVIKAEVVRAKGDTGPLKASVKLQACTKKNCLLPATINVEVP